MFSNPDLESKLQKARHDCERVASRMKEAAKCVRNCDASELVRRMTCQKEHNCNCLSCLDGKLADADLKVSKARQDLVKEKTARIAKLLDGEEEKTSDITSNMRDDVRL